MGLYLIHHLPSDSNQLQCCIKCINHFLCFYENKSCIYLHIYILFEHEIHLGNILLLFPKDTLYDLYYNKYHILNHLHINNNSHKSYVYPLDTYYHIHNNTQIGI